MAFRLAISPEAKNVDPRTFQNPELWEGNHTVATGLATQPADLRGTTPTRDIVRVASEADLQDAGRDWKNLEHGHR